MGTDESVWLARELAMGRQGVGQQKRMVMKYTVTVDGDVFEIEIDSGGCARINQRAYDVDLLHVGGNGATQSAGQYSLLMDNRSYEVDVADSENGQQWVMVGGRLYRTHLQRGHRDSRSTDDPCRTGIHGNGRTRPACGDRSAQRRPACYTEVRAPLPGLLVELRVREDEHVEEQQVVAIVESMKMNLEIRAPRDGVVCDLCVDPGRQVAQDEVLAILEPNGDGGS